MSQNAEVLAPATNRLEPTNNTTLPSNNRTLLHSLGRNAQPTSTNSPPNLTNNPPNKRSVSNALYHHQIYQIYRHSLVAPTNAESLPPTNVHNLDSFAGNNTSFRASIPGDSFVPSIPANSVGALGLNAPNDRETRSGNDTRVGNPLLNAPNDRPLAVPFTPVVLNNYNRRRIPLAANRLEPANLLPPNNVTLPLTLTNNPPVPNALPVPNLRSIPTNVPPRSLFIIAANGGGKTYTVDTRSQGECYSEGQAAVSSDNPNGKY